jgi:NADPH2:quinone reductase
MVSYTTSWHALVDRARLKPGETLLVLGAGRRHRPRRRPDRRSSGCSRYRLRLDRSQARHRAGGRRASAHRLALPSWRDDVKAANDGRPIDVVFDPIGGDSTERAFRTLAWKGRHLVVGFPGGIPALPTNLALLKGASLVGVNHGGIGDHEPELARAIHTRVLELGGQGILAPAIAERYPLEEYARAMADAAKGEMAGRIVLLP